jgi:hypothetical protein
MYRFSFLIDFDKFRKKTKVLKSLVRKIQTLERIFTKG